MNGLQPAELRIVERRAITPALASAAAEWHAARSTPCSVNESWLELVCAYGEEPPRGSQVIRLAAPPSDVAVGDFIDLDDTESLGMILPNPPAELFDVGSVQLTGRTELPSVGRRHAREDPPQRLSLAHRLDRTARGWAAHCERTPVDRYDELLAQLETVYPDKADPARQNGISSSAEPRGGGAAGRVGCCVPEASQGAHPLAIFGARCQGNSARGLDLGGGVLCHQRRGSRSLPAAELDKLRSRVPAALSRCDADLPLQAVVRVGVPRRVLRDPINPELQLEEPHAVPPYPAQSQRFLWSARRLQACDRFGDVSIPRLAGTRAIATPERTRRVVNRRR